MCGLFRSRPAEREGLVIIVFPDLSGRTAMSKKPDAEEIKNAVALAYKD
jgi:hypothetical protein